MKKIISLLAAISILLTMCGVPAFAIDEAVTEADLTYLALEDDFSSGSIDSEKWITSISNTEYGTIAVEEGAAKISIITEAPNGLSGGVQLFQLITKDSFGENYKVSFDMAIDDTSKNDALEYAGFYTKFGAEDNFYGFEWSRRIYAYPRLAMIKNGYESSEVIGELYGPNDVDSANEGKWIQGILKHYEVVVLGNAITIRINNVGDSKVTTITYTDENAPLTDGKFGAFLRTFYTQAPIHLTLDNVKAYTASNSGSEPEDPTPDVPVPDEIGESNLTNIALEDDFSSGSIDTEKWNVSVSNTDYGSITVDGGAAKLNLVQGSGNFLGGYQTVKLLTNTNFGSNYKVSFDMAINDSLNTGDPNDYSLEYGGFYPMYSVDDSFYAFEWSRRIHAYPRLAMVKNGYDSVFGEMIGANDYDTVANENKWVRGINKHYEIVVLGKDITIRINNVGSDTVYTFNYTDEDMTLSGGNFGVFLHSAYSAGIDLTLDNVKVYTAAPVGPQLDSFETESCTQTYYAKDFDADSSTEEIMQDFSRPEVAALSVRPADAQTETACLDLKTGDTAQLLANHSERLLIGDKAWSNYTAKMKMKIYNATEGETESVNIFIRGSIDGVSGYTISQSRRHTDRIIFSKHIDRYYASAESPEGAQIIWTKDIKNFDAAGWNTYKLTANGNVIKVYINDMYNPVLTYEDAEPITEGGFGLVNYTMYANDSHILVDDVEVKGVEINDAKQELALSSGSEFKVNGITSGGEVVYYNAYVNARVIAPAGFADKESDVFLAIYDDGNIVKVKKLDRVISTENNMEKAWVVLNSISNERDPNKLVAKVFVWEDETLRPLCATLEVAKN